jgi:hypothetical protein
VDYPSAAAGVKEHVQTERLILRPVNEFPQWVNEGIGGIYFFIKNFLTREG